MHERIYVALFNFALRGYIGARGSPKVIYLTRLKKLISVTEIFGSICNFVS